MNIQTDHYEFELPEDAAGEIVASIADETARHSVQDAIQTAGEGEAVRLPLGLADTLLNALSEWERVDAERLSEYDRNYFDWQEGGE